MACISLPPIPPLSLPIGIGVGPFTIGLAFSINLPLCCRYNINLLPPITIPHLGWNANLLKIVNVLIAAVDLEIDKAQLDCPLN